MSPIPGEAARALLHRLAQDDAFADAFLADPDAYLAGVPEADRAALRALDRAALRFVAVVDATEPEVAPEHPAAGRGGAGLAIAVWACVAFVVLWLVTGGAA